MHVALKDPLMPKEQVQATRGLRISLYTRWYAGWSTVTFSAPPSVLVENMCTNISVKVASLGEKPAAVEALLEEFYQEGIKVAREWTEGDGVWVEPQKNPKG